MSQVQNYSSEAAPRAERDRIARPSRWRGAVPQSPSLKISTSVRNGLALTALCLGTVQLVTQAIPVSTGAALGCPIAQVLAISGKWIAKPGKRELHQWSCVTSGEEILISGHPRVGEITIIYRTSSKPPHTEKCAAHNDCRNAYRVEEVPQPADPGSIIDRLFRGQDPKVVPGILHGYLIEPIYKEDREGQAFGTLLTDGLVKGRRTNGLLVQPTVVCENDGTVDLSSWWLNPVPVGRNSGVRYSITPSYESKVKLTPIWDQTDESQSTLVWKPPQPIETPVLYEVKTPSGDSDSSARRKSVALVAPQSSCVTSIDLFEQAVQQTRTWPSDTPSAAIWNFQMSILADLSTTSKAK